MEALSPTGQTRVVREIFTTGHERYDLLNHLLSFRRDLGLARGGGEKDAFWTHPQVPRRGHRHGRPGNRSGAPVPAHRSHRHRFRGADAGGRTQESAGGGTAGAHQPGRRGRTRAALSRRVLRRHGGCVRHAQHTGPAPRARRDGACHGPGRAGDDPGDDLRARPGSSARFTASISGASSRAWPGSSRAIRRRTHYLGDSIRHFPSPDALRALMEEAGLREVTYTRLTFGVAYLHIGRVPGGA